MSQGGLWLTILEQCPFTGKAVQFSGCLSGGPFWGGGSLGAWVLLVGFLGAPGTTQGLSAQDKQALHAKALWGSFESPNAGIVQLRLCP